MSCLSCICKIHLIFVSFLIMIFYMLIHNILFTKIYYYESKIRTLALNPHYIDFYIFIFYTIPIIIFILTFLVLDGLYRVNFLEYIIIDLKKANRFLVEENMFLKEKREIPTHIKHIYVEQLIKDKCNCSICLEDITKKSKIFLTLCGHLFHNQCMEESLNFSSKCPYCRTTITYDETD